MARFTFRLQSVLNLREKVEDQKELEYARALQKVAEEEAKERTLVERKALKTEELTELVSKEGIDPYEVSRYNDFIEVLKERIVEQRKAVATAKAAAEAKRLELVEAMRERKTIERLRENAFEEYLEEEKHLEQKQVDDVVSYKYAKS